MSLLRQTFSWLFDGVGNAIGSTLGSLNVALRDGDGNKITSFKNAITVHLSHGHNSPVNEYFDHHTGVTTTLAANAAAGDYVLNFTSAASFAVGNYISIDDTVIERTQARIISIATNAVTIDRPLDFPHLSGVTISQTTISMNVLGTLAAPVSYKLKPPTGEVWLISRFILTMIHAAAGDLTKFGSLTALTNGVLLRTVIGGQTYNYTVWHTNEGIKNDMYDVTFDDRAGGTGSYSTSAKGSLLDLDRVQARLDGAAGDYMEVLIRDDLTTMASFKVKVQGLIEGA